MKILNIHTCLVLLIAPALTLGSDATGQRCNSSIAFFKSSIGKKKKKKAPLVIMWCTPGFKHGFQTPVSNK